MFLPQITFNLRSLMFLHTNQICRSYCKRVYKYQTTLYYLSKNHLSTNLSSDELDRVKNVNDNDNRKYTEKHVCPLTKEQYVTHISSNAVSALNSIFLKVNKEFNTNCISFTYGQKEEKYTCTFNITWPCKMSFYSKAISKRQAKSIAAKQCLQWLYDNKKIVSINGLLKPLLYDEEDIKNILQREKLVIIHLESEYKYKIKSLINAFEKSIKPIVADQSDPDFKTFSLNFKEELEVDMSQSSFNQNLDRNLARKGSNILPVHNYREEILDALRHNQILILQGETGCGKSTQVPQFILDQYLKEGDETKECKIVVSQPRRVAVISLARRVASERDENIGNAVGYRIRFDHVQAKSRYSIMFYTIGCLLKIIEQNPTLKGISHVIIDEAHERSIQSDLLLKLLKDITSQNQSIKLIIMSATIDTDLFERYFSCKVINIPGTLYPVKMHFKDDIPIFQKDVPETLGSTLDIPFNKIVELVKWIVENKPPGGILCFLPGWQEIKLLYQLLQVVKDVHNVSIFPLHSKIPNHGQMDVFKMTPEGVRKIILATDIAESGITINDITYVIDTVTKKDYVYNKRIDKHVFTLNLISKASIDQRKGRAGRVRPGESYHLITRHEYQLLDQDPKANIHKELLDDLIINSKKFSNEKALDFFSSMIVPPTSESIHRSIKNLQTYNILDENENLTCLGKRLTHFSLNYKLARAIVFSSIFGCVKPIIVLISLLSEEEEVSLQDNFNSNSFIRSEKLKFHKTSDHISMLKCYEQSRLNNNHVTMNFKTLQKFYWLYMLELVSSGMISDDSTFSSLNTYANNNELIRAILFMGTNQLLKRNSSGFKNSNFTKSGCNLIAENGKKILLSRRSVNHKRQEWPSDILTYIKYTVFSNRTEVFDTSMLTPLSVLLFSNNEPICYKARNHTSGEMDQVYISINGIQNIELCCDEETAYLLTNLRQVLWSVVNYIISYKGLNTSEENLKLVICYKNELISFLSTMLCEASKHIDATNS